jgi:hypothetical protein
VSQPAAPRSQIGWPPPPAETSYTQTVFAWISDSGWEELCLDAVVKSGHGLDLTPDNAITFNVKILIGRRTANP